MTMDKIFLFTNLKDNYLKKLFFISLLLGGSLFAKPLYSFKSVGISYLDWTNSTEKKTTQRDFSFLKLDGGFGYDWMDFYGYVSLENPIKSYDDNSPHNQRYVGFVDTDFKLIDDFKLHIQDFYLNSKEYSVNDFVLGFSYKYNNFNGFWIKPFLGIHITNDTYFDGFNGYMTGWVFDYRFQIYNQNFSLFQWNEIEFKRTKDFYQLNDGTPIGDGKSYGLNGSISLWWLINNDFSSGAEYRYANHKLGSIEYQSAYIYTLKYNF